MKQLVKLELDSGITRGEKQIKELSLRRPTAGELRGLKILELINMDTDTLMKFLPRVTIPSINEAELNQMDPADFIKLSTESVGFLMPREQESTDSPIS
jgi:hypothetical protein